MLNNEIHLDINIGQNIMLCYQLNTNIENFLDISHAVMNNDEYERIYLKLANEDGDEYFIPINEVYINMNGRGHMIVSIDIFIEGKDLEYYNEKTFKEELPKFGFTKRF